MTMMPAPFFPRQAIAAPALRRTVAAMVRRRVPAGDVEDLAQTILCEALAAPGLPSDPAELRRFVAGIARHKVADFHRRTRRHDSSEVDELGVDPPPVEARALLARIVSSVASSVRERETLEWLVREHDGEQLRTIAEDAGLPAPAVRQRVSRLRRVLRAQWSHALALLLVAGACGVLAERARRESSAIVADPTGDPVARAAVVAQGQWRVAEVTAETSHAAALEAKVVDIRIQGRRVSVTGPALAVTRSITDATTRADGSLAIELRDETGAVQHATAKVDGDRMQLTLHDGRLRGTATLVRR
ncbi:MAG TPA: sigma factor [Labilithrix sp.]|nr:sigma factor [Labilithrix sp.]